MKARPICFDRILPPDRYEVPRMRAISPLRKQWVNGSTIHVMFLGGTAEQQSFVRSVAPEWTRHANLAFEWTTDPLLADVRVSFDANDGAWSYVGVDSLAIPKPGATMNLGWVDEAVVLHEFGHAIGLAHEHQSPHGGIVWNEAKVIADMAGAPNYWDEETTRYNVIERYAADQIHGTEFDPASIMLYAFPGNWTLNMPEGTAWNTSLSELDQAFVASAVMYPPTEKPAVDLPIWTPLAADIGVPGEVDWYRVLIETAGSYAFDTLGSTDVFLSLYGPDSRTRLVGENNDSGSGANPRLRRTLQPGVYYVAIRCFDPAGAGAYRIRAMRY